MGRYYSGDIEGKFMFAVQSSTAADRFGSTHEEPSYVKYFFSEEHIKTIEKELLLLKENYEKVVLFFESREGYTDEDLEKNGIVEEELSDYADYVLGEKILNCIKENGSCSFDAEL
jgi:hypothetical protein